MMFSAYLRDTVLVDFEPERNTFVVAVRNVFNGEVLLHRLGRTMTRILSDVAGQPVEIAVVLTVQGEQVA